LGALQNGIGHALGSACGRQARTRGGHLGETRQLVKEGSQFTRHSFRRRLALLKQNRCAGLCKNVRVVRLVILRREGARQNPNP